MTDSKHTPERAHLDPAIDGRSRGFIRSKPNEEGRGIAICRVNYSGRSFGEAQANARRLVAAWNATLHIPINEIEQGAAPDTAAERDRLAARVAELEGILGGLVSMKHGHPYGCQCPWCKARSALSPQPGGKSDV
jgi:hypothetical protein